jgi:hypothetical protein
VVDDLDSLTKRHCDAAVPAGGAIQEQPNGKVVDWMEK